MKIIPSWLREFVDIPVDDRKLAEDLTLAGISVESVEGEGARTVFDVDFTPNRVDAMNHYGVARDCAAVYDKDLKPLTDLVARVSDPSARVEDPRHIRHRNRRSAGLRPLYRARHPRGEDRAVTGKRGATPGAAGLARHQQRR